MSDNLNSLDQSLEEDSDEKLPKKKLKKELTPEEKELKTEEEKDRLLRNLHSGTPSDTKDRVAVILSNNINSRNSDIELAWDYWRTFHPEVFDGIKLTKGIFLKLPKISSLCRSRAKIQNEYNLFLAEDEVRQQRGKLEQEFKKGAISDRAPEIKSLFAYIDETGKNQEFLSLGSVWMPTFTSYSKAQEIRDWKKYSGIDYEFHFQHLKPQKMMDYKLFVQKFLNLHPEMSFKSIIIRNSGIKNKESVIRELTYYLVKKGLEHENSTKRAPLPRQLVVTIDDESEANDILKLEEIKDKLLAQKIEGLTLGNFTAESSIGNEYLQIADLFTGAINRKLHPQKERNHKDEFADYILEILGLDITEYLNDEVDNDNVKMFSFLKSKA